MNKSVVFRKVATSIWRDAGDPSVYGFTELDVTALKSNLSILPFIIKALSVTMHKNPELTSMMRWGRTTQRKDKMVSVMVNIPSQKNDLSLLTVDVSADPGLEHIRKLIDERAGLIRKHKDPHLGTILKIVRYLPKWLVQILLGFYTFCIYELDTRLGISFLPHRPFGSVIVSNVGSLGIHKALLPLVPLARASLMVSIGKSKPEAKVVEGEIKIRDIIHLGVTFDHRLFDGSHAAKMLNDFEEGFYELIAEIPSN